MKVGLMDLDIDRGRTFERGGNMLDFLITWWLVEESISRLYIVAVATSCGLLSGMIQFFLVFRAKSKKGRG